MVLQSIRDRLTGILAFLVLGVLVVPFAFVGVNSYFGGNTGNVVAMVNDVEITTDQFGTSFQQYRRRLMSMQGVNFDPVAFGQPIIRRQHLDQMIDQELMRQMALDTGLAVDDQRLLERIQSIPAFQVDGEFNQDLYLSRLAAVGQTPKQFEREIRADLILNQLPISVIASSLATPAELSTAIRLLEETRSFDAAMFYPEGDDLDVAFGDEEILAWYEGHLEGFRAPEQVSIEFVELNSAFLPQPMAPDEELLRSRFESQQGRFINPEQRQASHNQIEVPED